MFLVVAEIRRIEMSLLDNVINQIKSEKNTKRKSFSLLNVSQNEIEEVYHYFSNHKQWTYFSKEYELVVCHKTELVTAALNKH